MVYLHLNVKSQQNQYVSYFISVVVTEQGQSLSLITCLDLNEKRVFWKKKINKKLFYIVDLSKSADFGIIKVYKL